MRSRARRGRDAVVVETACDFFHTPALVYRDVIGAIDPLRIHHAASLVEEHRAVGEPLGDQSLELSLRGAGVIELRGMRAPQRLQSSAHEPELTSIGFHHALLRRRGLAGHGGVHEPQNARRWKQRQQHEQHEEPPTGFESKSPLSQPHD